MKTKSRIRKMKLYHQLVCIFLIVSILPLALIGGLTIKGVTSSMSETVEGYSKKIVEQLNFNIEYQIDYAKITIADLAVYAPLTNYVRDAFTMQDADKVQYLAQINTKMASIFNVQEGISGLEMIKDDKPIYNKYRTGSKKDINEFVKTEKYKELKQLSNSEFSWNFNMIDK